jgi:uncharacterized protein (TIGR04141 family)
MQPRVYKANDEYDTVEKVTTFLTQDDRFTQIGEREDADEQVGLTLFNGLGYTDNPAWIDELEIFFGVEDRFEQRAQQYNAIIVVKTLKSIYLIPNGYAYHTVEKIADPDFGLSFAEKTVTEDNISLKGVSYIQRNKIREVTHYKEEQNEFSGATESYFSVSAKPIDEQIFGSNIDCGKGVSFSKDFAINSEAGREEFYKLFNEIDIAFYDLDRKSNLPRFRMFDKNAEEVETLNQELLNGLKNNFSEENISLGINRIQLSGDKIKVLNAIDQLYIHRKHNPHKKEKIGLDGENIIEFIEKNANAIESLNDLKIIAENNNGDKIKEGDMSKFIFCQIEYDFGSEKKAYVLDEGRWGYFNDRFYDLLEKQLEVINDDMEIDDDFSIEYPTKPGKLVGEDAYIENLLKEKDNFYKLHKRFISSGEVSIEVADIYDSENDELLTIKRGVKTSTAIYSFDQSILGTRILLNPDEFDLKEELSRSRKRHNEIPDKIVNKILECRNQRVLWLVSDEPQYVYDGVDRGDFELRNFKSVLLRLKIIDWYTFLQENSHDIKIYFGLDLPVERSTDG